MFLAQFLIVYNFPSKWLRKNSGRITTTFTLSTPSSTGSPITANHCSPTANYPSNTREELSRDMSSSTMPKP